MEDVSSYGIVRGRAGARGSGQGVYRIRDLVEKPPRDRSAVESRDHRPLHPHARYLPRARGDRRRIKSGEIQLTNGLRRLLQYAAALRAAKSNGVRHDTGNKLGFLKATVYFALKRPDLAEPFREYLKTLELSR